MIAVAACLVGGCYANAHATKSPAPAPPIYKITWSIEDYSMERDVLGLCIDIVIAICIKAIDLCSISLRSTLATEDCLTFTTNLRLARGNFGNGTIMHAIMAMLLIASYASSVILPRYTYEDSSGELQPLTNDSDLPDLAIWPIPLIVLGAVLLLQAIISILTSPPGIQAWNASQFDLTAAAILDPYTHITYHPGRCTMSVHERHAQPRAAMPWTSHPRVQRSHGSRGCSPLRTSLARRSWCSSPIRHCNLSWSFFPSSAMSTHILIEF
ncbi:hypothetical protein FIBSPDRAFT_939934 [Athelia psychrophila]|uniref:Uncharacterized protein n=1 Tax=Athelia psychrophila TaxID=1759441 RepID=A0A167WYM3_9AGAM|nr:hypothetical protein FIBSPDRAFT_939934 [Fibularhizoctonia sp. CBS 109695]